MSSLPVSGTFRLKDVSVIEFTGDDWQDWLQGQITQDIKLLTADNPISFCICAPTGQLLTFGDLHLTDSSGLMFIPSETVKSVLARVEQMVILEECVAKVVTPSIFHSTEFTSPYRSNRIGVSGFDHFDLDSDVQNLDLFERARLAAKKPRFGLDTNSKTLPPELGSEFESQYIHYSKGCYTGQEVLQRIHSRGHVNRVWGVYRSETEFAEGFISTSSAALPEGGWLLAGYLRHDEALPTGLERLV
jgi:tRNA-modifying protein YgfZ